MNRLRRIVLLCLAAASLQARAQWTPPTPEELSMTSQPQVPGAAAVYLYKEETTDDDNHFFSVYVRLKVLTDKGKEQANVEIPFEAGGHADLKVEDVSGRTIHADGTIVPFTGKPYEKLIEKTNDTKFMSKIFSLPDVQVGSILEYRYKLRYEDHYYIPPEWFIQSDFFLRKGHYGWKTTARELQSDRGTINSISWFPILPEGTNVVNVAKPGTGGGRFFTVDVADIEPTPTEDYLPPLGGNTFRVLFFYTEYHSGNEFWVEEGKRWSKDRDKFIGPGSAVKAAVNTLVAPTDSPIDKLHKIYAFVMTIENTVYTRARTSAEERANGNKEIHNTDDVLNRKRGSDDQITELFVAMCRAAGLKAYTAAISNRDRHFFLVGFLSLAQLDDYVAIVEVDGKEMYFDPGQRYMPFGRLAWKHTMVEGIRQADKGATFAHTPPEPYTAFKIQRIADLTLGTDGNAEGTVRLTYVGAAGVHWRQATLTGDATSLDKSLVEACQSLLGKNMEAKVTKIENLDDYEKPLTVSFHVNGPIASSAGRRTLIPSDLFQQNNHPTFPSKERKYSVFFHYPHMDQDVVRIHFPPTLAIESLPKEMTNQYQKQALYTFKTEQTPNSFTIRRDYTIGEIVFPLNEYPALRTYYSTFETQDHEPVVLKPATTTATTAPGN